MSQTAADPPGSAYPPAVLRRWSDALAGAGLFAAALLTHPEDDLFRRAELAVLAAEHALALRLLKEYDAAREHHEPAEPAAVLLVAVARTQAGEPGAWQEVLDAAAVLPRSAWTSWLVALAAAIGPHLDAAGPAALIAVQGGCRDPRLRPIAAAGIVAQAADVVPAGKHITPSSAPDSVPSASSASSASSTLSSPSSPSGPAPEGEQPPVHGGPSWQQCAEAVQVLERLRVVQLAGEDALGATLDLLTAAGLPGRAAALAAFACTERQVPQAAQDAWREAAKARQLAVPRRLRMPGRRSMARDARRFHAAHDHDLTCRCAGSTGWIGPDRSYYVSHHLTQADADPVPGLGARLLTCRATNLRFLDLAGPGLTLPVDAGQ